MARYDQETLFKEVYFPPREEIRAALVEAGLVQEFQPLVDSQATEATSLANVRAQLQIHSKPTPESASSVSAQAYTQETTELPQHPALKALHELHKKRQAQNMHL